MQLDLDTFLPYRLHRVAGALSKQARDVYRRKHWLTVPEWRALATIGQFEKITASGIGAHSDMHKTKVSRAVAALEERRWLVRETNAADRREEFLTLTKLGRKAYDEIVPDLVGFENALTERLGTIASRELLAGLKKLEAALLRQRHAKITDGTGTARQD
jgi:DNA-binding MarR family transcriptional regulator